MRPSLPFLAFAACAFGGAAVQAQESQTSSAAAAEEFRRLCATVSMHPADARERARRAECILSGVLPSQNPIEEARMLARAAWKAGEPSGGVILYLAYVRDPAYQAVRDGKVDPQAYARLAALNGHERTEQIEAIEALGFAAGKNHVAAGMLLANYFHDTVAPRNVSRMGAIAALLMRIGEKGPIVERFAREADTIARVGPTKASARSFLEAYHNAAAVAKSGYALQVPGKACDAVELQSVRSGEIENPAYLPLKGALVEGSYLVKGHWQESWTFRACGAEIPVKVEFQADGWGGSTATASHDKGG